MRAIRNVLPKLFFILFFGVFGKKEKSHSKSATEKTNTVIIGRISFETKNLYIKCKVRTGFEILVGNYLPQTLKLNDGEVCLDSTEVIVEINGKQAIERYVKNPLLDIESMVSCIGYLINEEKFYEERNQISGNINTNGKPNVFIGILKNGKIGFIRVRATGKRKPHYSIECIDEDHDYNYESGTTFFVLSARVKN